MDREIVLERRDAHLMAINRRFLYVGLFLVAIGGVLVAVDLSAVDTSALGGVLRLWPVAVIALGAGIVLRRSRYALVAGIIAAMLPGLVLGGGLAVAPRHGLDCGAGNVGEQTKTQSGTFSRGGAVQVDTSCCSISMLTQPGNAWQLTSSSTTGREPDVELQGDILQIASTGSDMFENGRDAWNLTLPTAPLEHLLVTVNAGRATAGLAGANLGTLGLTGNGADMVVDASGATVTELDGRLDFGRLAIQLPQQGQYSGSFRVTAGELRICVPFFLGVHVDFSGSPREVRINGLQATGSAWENEAYASATNRADLSVKVNFGSVLINPIGGCK